MSSLYLRPRGGRIAGRCLVLSLLALVVGCGGNQAYVSGKVLYKGQPVTGGLVTFFPADNAHRPVVAPLDENGRYSASLPVGEVKIAVDNRALQPDSHPGGGFVPAGIKLPPVEKQGEVKENPAAPKRPPGVYVPIPEDYADDKTSGLHYTVQPGSQTHDIELPEIRRRER